VNTQPRPCNKKTFYGRGKLVCFHRPSWSNNIEQGRNLPMWSTSHDSCLSLRSKPCLQRSDLGVSKVTVTNTLAYYSTELIHENKKFCSEGPGAVLAKNFLRKLKDKISWCVCPWQAFPVFSVVLCFGVRPGAYLSEASGPPL
jgi:hypothetical protein